MEHPLSTDYTPSPPSTSEFLSGITGFFSGASATPAPDHKPSGLFSAFSNWWNKPWGSTIGEAESNIVGGITKPLIPVLVLAIIGGIVALHILNKVK